ncbi:protein disulfide-isomerase A3-like [Homarus americanus]|uniref:protein disulfide-isomerase A3-like n=1 Tax=Homarus americanus TaxID=6706 RepID=UPI001C438566|nr:protein disulfide-isomerase A3-like [Homarus americanus]
MAPRLLILFTLVAAAFADDVLQLGDADFDTKVGSYDTVLVMFYAPWCGHCKRLKPEFEKAATSLKTNDPLVILAKVDCTEDGKDTCGKYGVSGYPTLKIFRGGDLSSDYNGPREANGIVKYMRSQVGPASKELNSIEVAEAFLSAPEVSVLFFGDDSKLKDAFLKAADKLRETVRFGHSVKAEINEKYGYDNVVVLIRPKHLENKFEETSVVYEGPNDKSAIETFVKDNFHGLVGHRTQDSAQDFGSPLVVAYYNVDYVKNVKGTNYWRNRVLKVAQNFREFNYAVSNKDDFQHELNEFGLDFVPGDKPVICARDSKSQKFIMKEDFSMETFEAFLTKLKAGELEPYVKSEPIPDQDGPVAVAVAKNFDELVTNSDKDVMIEFYAPWCGHCKKLAPTYEELGTAMKDEAVEIVKMDATANDVPSSFNVRGFPTLFWKPKGGEPVPYNGGRELDDFIPYIAKEASSELNGWDRKGNPKKTEL